MAYKILYPTIEQEETPKGKRTVRLNIWGNWIGYVGRKRWLDFGGHASSE